MSLYYSIPEVSPNVLLEVLLSKKEYVSTECILEIQVTIFGDTYAAFELRTVSFRQEGKKIWDYS